MKFLERNIFPRNEVNLGLPLAKKQQTFHGFINCRLLLNVSSRTCGETIPDAKGTSTKWNLKASKSEMEIYNGGSAFPKGSRFWFFQIRDL